MTTVDDDGSSENLKLVVGKEFNDCKEEVEQEIHLRDEAETPKTNEEQTEIIKPAKEACSNTFTIGEDQCEKRVTNTDVLQGNEEVPTAKEAEGSNHEENSGAVTMQQQLIEDHTEGIKGEEEGKEKEKKGEEKLEDANKVDYVWTSNDTFFTLIQFFEATFRETLKPTDETGRQLPVEIFENTLGHVSNRQTYHACAKVSRTFREILQQAIANIGRRYYPRHYQGRRCRSVAGDPAKQTSRSGNQDWPANGYRDNDSGGVWQ